MPVSCWKPGATPAETAIRILLNGLGRDAGPTGVCRVAANHASALVEYGPIEHPIPAIGARRRQGSRPGLVLRRPESNSFWLKSITAHPPAIVGLQPSSCFSRIIHILVFPLLLSSNWGL